MNRYGVLFTAGLIAATGVIIKNRKSQNPFTGGKNHVPTIFVGMFFVLIIESMLPDEVADPFAYLILASTMFLYFPEIVQSLGLNK